VTEILFPRVRQSRIRRVDEMRQRGLTWESIGHEIGAHADTVSRWHRALKNYGIEVFARG
jgi:uncharacterized protein YerC